MTSLTRSRAFSLVSRLLTWVLAVPAVMCRCCAISLLDRPSALGLAFVDLALYLVVLLGAGAWRASRDA